MKSFYYLLVPVIVTLIACSGGGSGPQYDLKGFDTEGIGGGGTLASYSDNSNNLLTQGTVLHGVRNGAWVTYHEGGNKIKTITNYLNGKKNGIEISLNDRGQIESLTTYKNDILHGLKSEYRLGKPLTETTYRSGKIEGPFSVYTDQGKIQKKGSLKNGKQDGLLQFFDDQGNVTLEYEYKDGEKIGGGIVEKPTTQ